MTAPTSSTPHVVIRASAGSGKTFRLSNRYLELLLQNESPRQILASTFTRKAAAEILTRVLRRLATAAVSEIDCEKLAEQLGHPLTPLRAHELLALLVREIHTLQVSTLDSFFQRIAAGFGLELGFPLSWRLVDEDTENELRNKAIQKVLEEGTRDDTVRLLRLLAKGEIKRSVGKELLQTVQDMHALYRDSNAAAWKSIPQISQLDSEECERQLQRLRHATLPADKRLERAWNTCCDAIAREDWDKTLQGTLGKNALKGEAVFSGKEIPPEAFDPLRKLVRHAAAARVTRVAHENEATYDLLQRFDRAYRELQEQQGALRFDDITRALATNALSGDLDGLYYRIDTRIHHLLLDEFQDTSASQWSVLRPIAEEVASHADGSHSFFCVGDVKQSIYGWRNAEPAIFKSLSRRLPGIREEPLNISYRSAPPIIKTVNAVFDDLLDNPAIDEKREDAVRLWHEDFCHHTTARVGLAGYVRLVVAPQPVEGESPKDATLRFAADEITRLHTTAPDATIGVLVRTNDAVARIIQDLLQRGISASEEGGVRITDSSAVTAVLALLRLTDHPGDTVARFHVTSTALGPVVRLPPRASATVVHATLSRIRRALAENGTAVTIAEWVEAMAPACNRRERRRLRQLVDLAERFEAKPSLRPSDFLRFVETTKVEDPTSSRVRVMTVHQAKGLQFDTVVLPALDDPLTGRNTPTALTLRDPETGSVSRVSCYFPEALGELHTDLAELHEQQARQKLGDSLSVLYVALTRPVHALHLIVAPPKKTTRKKPSPGASGGTFSKTAAGLLRAALAPDEPWEPEAVLFELGSPEWYQDSGERSDERQKPAVQTPALRFAKTPSRRRHLPRETPSSARDGTSRDEASRLFDHEFRLDRVQARRRGGLLHAWFETIEWIHPEVEPADSWDEDALLRMALRRGIRPDEAQEILREFVSSLQAPTVRAVFDEAAYRKEVGCESNASLLVQRERPFALPRSDRILAGTFDRLVVISRNDQPVEAEVIDFKTDRVGDDANELARRTAGYSPQLMAYRDAAAELFQLEPAKVRTRLLFVTAGVSVEVP